MPTEPLPYTCALCGCLCDDLEIRAESGVVVEARGACELARPRLVGLCVEPTTAPPCRVDGREASADEAVEAAAKILDGSRAPLVFGLVTATNEAAREAVALADRIGAAIEVGDAASAWPRVVAMQRNGSIGATLGEVKARADVVVFFGCDPATTHPRHFDRYSLVGREGRRVIVIDDAETETAKRADVFLRVAPDRELDLLLTLRALAREAPLDLRRVEAATGHGLDALQGVVETLQGARYGAWFMGALAGRGAVQLAEARRQAVTALVRDLARKTRFVAIGLGEAGNAHGSESVLAWQTGFTPGVDLGAGFPESWPGESSAAARLARGAFDAALVVGGPAADPMPAGKPWIFVGDPEDEAFARATVALPAGTPGIDDAGTYTRVDGVSLPVRAPRASSMPGAAEWLARLRAAIGEATP
jgi:formylmethanofuran dehydrogenase subunit B